MANEDMLNARQPNGDTAALPLSCDTIQGCTAEVDRLLSKHDELSQKQQAFDEELRKTREEEAELRDKIKELEQPLEDLDAIVFTEEELAAVLHRSGLSSDTDCHMSLKPVRGEDSERGGKITDCNTSIEAEAIKRLGQPDDTAHRDTLDTDRNGPNNTLRMVESGPRAFGPVPAFVTLPSDATVSMIVSCNRLVSSLSQYETIRLMPSKLQQRVLSAQHYMSGRQHVMYMTRETDALWSRAEVRRTLGEHADHVDQLVEALRVLEVEQQMERDQRAQNFAMEISCSKHAVIPVDEFDPTLQAVQEHIHNFRCQVPFQLTERGKWRHMFEDRTGLVVDPKQELLVPRFTMPWTKQEKDAMEHVLGEVGKKFVDVANNVGTRTVAECIDRYYKIHLRDEFKTTWRKMARQKRAGDGRHKRHGESKVLATVTKVQRHRYETLPRHGDSVYSLAAKPGEWNDGLKDKQRDPKWSGQIGTEIGVGAPSDELMSDGMGLKTPHAPTDGNRMTGMQH